MAKDNSYKTYGLYNATFVRTVQPGATIKREPWSGKLPSNKSTSGTNKYKKQEVIFNRRNAYVM